ncbi:MAG TPA: protein kinase [Kiritimatiellia bacterium]
MKPFQLPGYEIGDKVGEGGMATVWKARQVSLDRPVAIKVLSKQAAPDKDAMERFRLEAQAAAKINHHAIVQVYDAGQVDGLPYYVMEFIEGCSVGDLLERKGKLSERNAILIAEGIALGLGYAWEKASIIHCDVKPDNIMVERDGSVKVADLGLARFIIPRADGDDEHLIIGTPNYSSPEQAQGVPDLDCRSDIYSLGAMLYHMVTGVLPFAGIHGSAAMDKHVSDHLPDSLDLNPEISQGLAWLIERMMVKDRSLRPQSWVSVLYDLKEVKEGRFPSKLPEVGLSTVLRSDKRLAEPPQPVDSSAPKDTSDTTSGIRRKIVISKEEFEQIRTTAPPKAFETDRALLVVLLLGGLAFAAYWFFLRAAPAPPAAEAAPPPAAEIVEPSAVAAPAPVEPAEAVAEADPVDDASPFADDAVDEPAAETESTAGQPIRWENAAFAEGARLFNNALKAYEEFHKDGKDPAKLKVVERDCRRALNLFDSVKQIAPDGVNMEGLVSQCYRLLSDVRQSMLITPGPSVPVPSWEEQRGTSVEETPAPNPAPVVASAPVVPTSAPPPAVTNAAPTNAPAVPDGPVATLTLSPLWNSKLSGSDTIWNELYQLLSPYGTAAVDLKGDPRIALYGPIKYLMPMKEAAKALNATIAAGRVLETPGFPAHSFWCYVINGPFEDGFNKMILIADSAERVVGIQLMNDQPDALWLDPGNFSEAWHTHNFLDPRSKTGRKWRIAFRIRYLEKTLNIDSELVSFDERASGQLGKPRERATLILPHQVVNLILHRIEKGR